MKIETLAATSRPPHLREQRQIRFPKVQALFSKGPIEKSVHVEVLLPVALIAVVRSLLLQDLQSDDPLSLIGLAAILVGLTGRLLSPKRR